MGFSERGALTTMYVEGRYWLLEHQKVPMFWSCHHKFYQPNRSVKSVSKSAIHIRAIEIRRRNILEGDLDKFHSYKQKIYPTECQRGTHQESLPRFTWALSKGSRISRTGFPFGLWQSVSGGPVQRVHTCAYSMDSGVARPWCSCLPDPPESMQGSHCTISKTPKKSHPLHQSQCSGRYAQYSDLQSTVCQEVEKLSSRSASTMIFLWLIRLKSKSL